MKLKRLFPIILVVLLLVPAVGWAAVYYLSPSGSATPPYDTWEKAANNLNQILSLELTGENTIYVAEGTYSGSANYINLGDAKYANLSIIGKGHSNLIIFDPNTYTACYIHNTSITNVLFKNITITNGGSGYCVRITDGTNIKFINCSLVAKNNHSGNLVQLSNSSNAIFDYCNFWSESYNSHYGVVCYNDSSIQLSYCMLFSPNGSFETLFLCASSQIAEVNNCILAKSGRVLVSSTGSGSLTVQNTIILGSSWMGYENNPINKSSSGDLIVKNCIVLPATYFPNLLYSEGVTTSDVINSDPCFQPFGIRAFLIPRVDDNSNVDYAIALANLLKEYGYKGTFFVYTYAIDSIKNKLQNLIQSGAMEVACHTYSHANLTYNHALHFEYTGSDSNPTVEFDSSRVIHLRTDGSDDVDIDTTQPDADTLGEIISNFSGTNNWIISKSSTDGQDTSHISNVCKAESLAEMSATAAPCDIDFLKESNCEGGNCEGYYKVEVYEPRIDLTNAINSEGNIVDPQTGQIYEARTFVPPYGAGDENVIEALRTSGYIGAGGISSFRPEALPYNVFKISIMRAKDLIVEGDEQQTTKNAELFAINAAINGLAVTVISHDASEATMDEWRWILNGFKLAQKHYNIEVTSLQLAIEALKRFGTYDPSTGDVDIHWSMPSFRLRHDSPCIDAGVKIAGIHDQADWKDLAGNMIHYGRAPDIGCFEAVTDVVTAWGMLPWYGRKYCVRW